MSLKIQADNVVKTELESRGVDSSVGVFGSHHVQIGKGTPVRLDVIKSAKVPYAGFTEAKQIMRGKAGIHQTSSDVLKTLATPGSLDAGKLLGLLKAQQTHLNRLDKLNQLTPAQKNDADGLWMFTKEIENLSNAELSAIYQKFTSAEMDLLQTALIREGQINPKANDARMAASRLFDLQALILKEVSNRVSLSNLEDLRTANPEDETLKDDHVALPKKLSEQYGGADGTAAASTYGDDMTATNLGILVDVAARSATTRERTGVEEAKKLQQRGLDNVSTKQLGDVLRSAEFTINMDPEILLGDNSIIANPNAHFKNIWHLADQGIKPQGDGYLAKRDGVEHTVFPEMSKHKRSSDERPVYGALNVQGSKLGAAMTYGHAVIVLKEDVKKRATYTLNDSFFAAKVKITPQRRMDFYRLLDGVTDWPQSLKDALLNPNTQEHKDLEAWLDKIEQIEDVTLNESFKRNSGPGSIRNHFRGAKNSFDSTEDEQRFLGLLIKCFGDTESTRELMATHDNIESLLPQMGDIRGNALARAAIDQKNGLKPKAVLTDAHYIEAQIQGPIVPTRDIAEIRVNLQDFAEDQRPAVAAKLKRFQKETGIKVVIQDFDWSTEVNEKTNIEDNVQGPFNAAHVDQTALATEKENILSHLEENVVQYTTKSPRSKLTVDGEELHLSGDILGQLAADFTTRIDQSLAQESHNSSASSIISNAFNSAAFKILDNKKTLLKELDGLNFANPAQKKAFAQMVCNSADIDTVEKMKLIHKQATLQAAAMAELAAIEPPPTSEQVIARLARLSGELNADLATYAATLGKNAKFNFAEKCTELKHISTTALTLLKNAEPPVGADKLQKLQSMLDSQAVRGFAGQLVAMSDADEFKEFPDMGNVRLFAEALDFIGQTLSDAVGVEHKRSRPYIGPLSAIPKSTRGAIWEISPSLADTLDQAHPAHQPFPRPANPNALPQNKEGRKEFLVGVLEEYRQKELGKAEYGRSVHGRGHIVRAYIFANVFCNILAEQGVNVDKNAVILGISGHDLGRAGLGNDKWEAESGDKTNAALRERYGANTTGEPYEHEIADSIQSVEIKPPNARKRHVPVSQTLEAQLLQSADSLDIGRTAEFDDYYFDFLRDKNGQVSPEAKKIRDQLIQEADFLQRLTNPLCAHRGALQHIDQIIIEETDRETEKMLTEQKEKIDNSIVEEFVNEAKEVGNEEFFNNVEDAIRNHREMFPLLSHYYLDAQ